MKVKLTFVLTLAAVLIFAAGSLWAQQKIKKTAHPYTEKVMSLDLSVDRLAKSFGMVKKVAAIGDPVDMDAALAAGADYLKHAQADITEDNAGNGNPDVPDDPDDGGWDWNLTDPNYTHSTSVSSDNLYGVTAQGLLNAYQETGDATYMTAIQDAASYMITDPDIDSAADLVFLMKFQDLPGVTPDIYKNAAKAKYDAKITDMVNKTPPYPATATGLAEYIRDVRAGQGYEDGIIPWDIASWAVSAQMLYDRFGGTYDQDADDIAEVL